jgi:hypothetical protein
MKRPPPTTNILDPLKPSEIDDIKSLKKQYLNVNLTKSLHRHSLFQLSRDQVNQIGLKIVDPPLSGVAD